MVTLSAPIEHWALRTPEKMAARYGETRVSYRQLHERVCKAAGILAAQGIKRGDIVALLMKNSIAFIELALASSHLGAVTLPINYRLGREEVEYILKHAGAKLLYVDAELEPLAGSFRHVVITPSLEHGASGLDPQAEPVHEPAAVGSADMFRLMYTSGTTGHPKGVIHSYENWYWKTLDHITDLQLTADDRILVTGPLYHVGAFDLPGLALFEVGGSMTILREFDPVEVLQAIQSDKLTCAWFAPVMSSRLLSFPTRSDYDVTSLKWAIGGGERTPVQRIQEFGSFFVNARYIDGYGLTETCSGDTLMQPGREIEKIGSAGRALSHVRVEIRDEHGTRLPANQSGEICLLGPKVTKGYWRDEQKTRESFFGDWFRTGDMGYLDEDGFIFLVDRKKDMIISGAENIASSEVERVLYQMEVIEEAAVIGMPDLEWGERVTAVVALRQGRALTLDDVREFCREKLGKFKIPRQLIIMDALPRNPSGKILKRVLREQLAKLDSH